jgi:hypothetical protein
VQITVTCPKPPEPVKDMTLASDTGASQVQVSIGSFRTFVSGEHVWSVDKSVDNATLSVGVGELPRTVTYTVRVSKAPRSDFKHYVAGRITVLNVGTSPTEVTAVAVTADSAAVPAKCPGGGGGGAPIDLPPNAPLVCTFNVTWNKGAEAGALGARADMPDTSAFAAPQPFDFTGVIDVGTRGATANVFDDVTSKAPNVTGVPNKWFVLDGVAPPAHSDGITLGAEDSREYSYTMQLGPFTDAASCGTYTVTNVAAVEPAGGGPAATARVDVALSVVGCRSMAFQSASSGPAGVRVEGLKSATLKGAEWRVESAPEPAAVMTAWDKPAAAKFAVKFTKVPTVKHEVSGTVRVSNSLPDDQPLDVSKVTVLVEPAGGAAATVDAKCDGGQAAFQVGGRGGRAAGAAAGLAARLGCQVLGRRPKSSASPHRCHASSPPRRAPQVAPGGTVDCAFTAVVAADGAGGAVLATVLDKDGVPSDSGRIAFTFDGAETRTVGDEQGCATVSTVRGAPAGGFGAGLFCERAA